MARRWTDAQTRAIVTLDKDVCVAAGAGSGKTGVLTQRFVRIVQGTADGSLPPDQQASVDQILVFTFTDKATREMKSRIARELTELGLHEQRRAIETAYLSTMHGFCSRILKENPFEAGLDPEFEVLDETQARRLLRRSVDAAVEQGFADDDREIVELVDAVQNERIHGASGGDPLRALAESVESVLARLRETGMRRPDAEEFVASGGGRIAERALAPVDALLAPVLADVAAAAEALRPLSAAVGGALELTRREVVRLAEQVAARVNELRIADPQELMPTLEELHKASLKKVRAVSAADNGVAQEIGRIQYALDRAKTLFRLDAERDRRAATLAQAFWRLLIKVWAAYDAAKAERGALDQTDLQAEAVHLLATRDRVRLRYQRRFRHILVDEFQDTNRIQLRLVQLLHEGRPAGAPRSRLFVVGDEQQSIYGFRGTDARIFADTVKRYQAGDGRVFVEMVQNYRSRPEIVAFVNTLFGRISGASGVSFRALQAAGDYEPLAEPCVEVLVAPNMSRPQYVSAEASALAEHIRAMVQSGSVKRTDRRSDRLGQPMRYGDCAVLFRALTNIVTYEDAFARAGVPHYVVGGGRGYYARREVRDILNVLTVLDTPADDLALAATLRSPMVGVSMDTLAELNEMGNREDRPRGPLYLSLREFARQGRGDDRDRKAVGEFVAHLDSLRAIADTLTVGEILERIIARTQYDARVLVRPGGRRRLANVRKLLWMAHAASDRRVSEFVRNLREIERLAEREGDAPTEEEAADVVRFVTVHKAKGLEFPVVYIADLNRSLTHSSEGLFECDPSAPAIACRIGDYKSVAYRAISESRNDRDLREAHRVLYVAMTRARERLVLSGSATARRAGSSWADTVFGQLGIVAPPQAPQLLSWADGVRVAPLPVAPPVP